MLKIENKIAILLNWPRELDMYGQLLKYLPKNKIRIIVNDIKGFDKERYGNSAEIKKILIEKKIYNFDFLSKIFKKKKFKIILSTGEACSHKLTFYSLIKWVFGQTTGRFIEWSNLSILFKNLFNRPLSAEGKFSIPFERWFPEKSISEISIKYPQGMDLNYIYPDINWKNHFDIFFTHGRLHSKMIQKKFPYKETFIIGYPRYEKLKKFIFTKQQKKNLYNINIFNKNKKTILWLPTHFKYKEIYGENIYKWMEKIRYLSYKYNIIIRPHPKTLKTLPKLINYLERENLIIDTQIDRKIGDLINFSDLIMCDYGGAIFSSLYLEKKIILLNYYKDCRYVLDKINSLSFDIEIRNFLTSCNLDMNNEIFEKIIKKEIEISNKKKIMTVKKYYYGVKNYNNSISKTTRFLVKKLDK